MAILVKIERFQIKQNVIKLKSTLASTQLGFYKMFFLNMLIFNQNNNLKEKI